MNNHEYYWEINMDRESIETIGPKRTFDFFKDSLKQARDHIVELYDSFQRTEGNIQIVGSTSDYEMQQKLYRESRQVMKKFGIKDSSLEAALARILTNFVRFPKQDKNNLMTVYMSDLVGRFVLNPEKEDSLLERTYEYASFRASADYITVVYGLRSKPNLELPRIEAEAIKKTFTDGKRAMSLNDLLQNAATFYEHASATASQVLDTDFFRLKDSEKMKWERAARVNEKIATQYDKCLEILRTANYQVFKN